MTEEYVVGIGPKDAIPAGAGANGELPFVFVISTPAVEGLFESYRGNADSAKSYGEVLDVKIGLVVTGTPSAAGGAYVGNACRNGEDCGVDPDQKVYGEEVDVLLGMMFCIAVTPGEEEALKVGMYVSTGPWAGTLFMA